MRQELSQDSSTNESRRGRFGPSRCGRNSTHPCRQVDMDPGKLRKQVSGAEEGVRSSRSLPVEHILHGGTADGVPDQHELEEACDSRLVLQSCQLLGRQHGLCLDALEQAGLIQHIKQDLSCGTRTPSCPRRTVGACWFSASLLAYRSEDMKAR